MKPTSVKFMAEAAHARLLGNENATVIDVKIDSRVCQSGDLFVCVVGEINDGHNFAKNVLDKDCKIFLMSNAAVADEILALCMDATILLVADTSVALKDIAVAYLAQFNVKKVAVTGSVGKTTTKMLTASVIASKYNTVCTQKNLNTHLGLCLTCFLVNSDTQVVVFEMGMDRPHEIAEYVEWVRPDIAIVTNIGISHLEKMGTRDAIADGKLEITNKLTSSGFLIANCDSDYLRTKKEIQDRVVSLGQNASDFGIILAGKSDEATFKVSDVAGDETGISFILSAYGGSGKISMPILGEHNANNAALAIACGALLKIDFKDAANALAKVIPTEKRLLVTKLSNDLTLIDDSYNASPDSMKSAIASLALITAKRRIAVLGVMLELGTEEERGHTSVGQFAAEHGVDILVAVADSKNYYAKGVLNARGIGCSVIAVDNVDQAIHFIESSIKPGDAILVKGSNITGVAKLAEFVKDSYR